MNGRMFQPDPAVCTEVMAAKKKKNNSKKKKKKVNCVLAPRNVQRKAQREQPTPSHCKSTDTKIGGCHWHPMLFLEQPAE